MIIYKDIVTGDEIISDTYNLKDIDDVVYEVDCKMVTQGGVEVDIGANASAEEQEEALDEQTKQVIDVVDGFRMTYMEFSDKKQLAGQIKGFLKKAVEKMKEAGKSEDEIKKFQTGVQGYFTKKLAPNFKNLDCYAGESMDPDGMYVCTTSSLLFSANMECQRICFLNYREDGITPYMIIWKHALTEMKV
ncbi:MAG: hypothetical protein Q9163_003292 [Psora crenata]